ncbi:MAG: TIGR04063 family PEP-CTERM/XrtA system glycosyltransferase [Gammaproteobacteria bacterium]
MRILHILDHSIPLHSGYSFRTRAILEQQRALGWETYHLTSSKQAGAQDLEENADGLHFYRCLPLKGWQARTPLLNQLMVITQLHARLHQVAAQIKPDILNAHSPALTGVAALRVGRRLNIPVVYEVRAFWEDAAVDHGTTNEGGARYRLTRALESYVLKRAHAVTVLCAGLRQDILERGIAPERVTVIPNAVDPSKFQALGYKDEALAAELGLGEAKVLGFIGSFYAYEGLPLLLEALPEILSSFPQTHVLLVGGGRDEARLKELARKLHVSDRVVFTGRVPHQEIERYYDLIDILVYPRYSMRLTELVTPLKPLEAMAQGRLVVASDVGGHKELIRDGETALLFKAGESRALAARIIELLQQPELWPRLRQNERNFIEAERTWAMSVARYREIYEGLLRFDRAARVNREQSTA